MSASNPISGLFGVDKVAARRPFSENLGDLEAWRSEIENSLEYHRSDMRDSEGWPKVTGYRFDMQMTMAVFQPDMLAEQEGTSLIGSVILQVALGQALPGDPRPSAGPAKVVVFCSAAWKLRLPPQVSGPSGPPPDADNWPDELKTESLLATVNSFGCKPILITQTCTRKDGNLIWEPALVSACGKGLFLYDLTAENLDKKIKQIAADNPEIREILAKAIANKGTTIH